MMTKLWFRPVFECPKCGSISYNPNDIRFQYCGKCQVFVLDEPVLPKTQDPDNPLVPRDENTVSSKVCDSLP